MLKLQLLEEAMFRYAILFALFAAAAAAQTAKELINQVRDATDQAVLLCTTTGDGHELLVAFKALEQAAMGANTVAISEGLKGRGSGGIQRHVIDAMDECKMAMETWLASRKR